MPDKGNLMRRPLPLFLALLLTMTATAGLAEDASAVNPYAKNYTSRMPAPKAATPGAVKVFRGQDKVEDYQTLLEDGYDLLGYSSFEAADVPPEKLTEQGERVNADVALVYTTRSGETPASVKLDRAKAKLKGEEASTEAAKSANNKFYNYFASFWTKLPRPLLGVHVKQDQDEGLPEKGLEVIAVIKGSPAAAAGLQKGDTLLKLGEVELSKPELLPQAAQRYAGQSAEIVFSRIGQEQRQTVTLNSRQ
jgi:hypothetical protein